MAQFECPVCSEGFEQKSALEHHMETSHPRRAMSAAEASKRRVTPVHIAALFKGAEKTAYDRVEAASRMPRYGVDCYAYCMVAAGNADLVVEVGLQTYDVAALIPIVEGAGGRFTNWEGGPAAKGGRVVASGDPALHEQVLMMLAG